VEPLRQSECGRHGAIVNDFGTGGGFGVGPVRGDLRSRGKNSVFFLKFSQIKFQ
jgi:hypothetical protein